MSADPSRARLAKRFLVTFGLVIAAVAIGALIASGGGDDDDDSESALTTSASSPAVLTTEATSIPSTGPSTVASTGDAESTRASLSDDRVDSTDPTDAPVTTAPVRLSPLPQPSLATYCRTLYGQPSTPGSVSADGAFRCSNPTVAAQEETVQAVCQQQFGVASRQVRIESAASALRCAPTNPVEVGPPDYDGFCRQRYGDGAKAAPIANDWYGWRCTSIQHGVFQIDEMVTDAACQAAGNETYSVAIDQSLDGWRCYGAP